MGHKPRPLTTLDVALTEAANHLVNQIGDEQLYAFVLYTSGPDDYVYVHASANTEEGLARKAVEYQRKSPAIDLETYRRMLRWSPGDWLYHAFAPAVARVQLPPLSVDPQRDTDVYRMFHASLQHVDRSNLLVPRSRRKQLTLAIMCGDLPKAFFLSSVAQLNHGDVWERTRAEYRDGIKAFEAALVLDG